MAKQKATGTKGKPAQPKGPYLSIAAICENVLEDKDSVLSLIRIIDKFILSVQGIGMQPPATMSGMVAPISFQVVVSFKEGNSRGLPHLKLVPNSPSGAELPPST